MRFRFTQQQDAFRRELIEFLKDESSSSMQGQAEGYDRTFSKKLARRGWIGMAWPREYGGQGLGPVEQMIYTEEMIRANAPRGYHFTAERQVGPSIIRHGTENQKRYWLKRIIDADVSFALGLSEPGAGSDLAAVTTRASRDGDHYIVNGQKIWTSGAHHADAIWLVVRTEPNAPKHRGISCLMVDLDSPGITIRPLYDMTGQHHFNEVFFDDVHVPVDRRVGEENRGWYVLAEHLDFERSGIERLVDYERLFHDLINEVRSRAKTGVLHSSLRLKLAELAIDFEVGRLMCYRSAWLQSVGLVPNYEASMAKLYGTEWCQRLATAYVTALGLGAAAAYEASPANGVQYHYLQAVSRTIAGGTSEIQRNIIATRGLGLPRS